MQKREYVGVTFGNGQGKTYTYHNDGPPVRVGQMVKVPASDGESWTRGRVVSATTRAPHHTTKPILGPIEQAPPAAA